MGRISSLSSGLDKTAEADASAIDELYINDRMPARKNSLKKKKKR